MDKYMNGSDLLIKIGDNATGHSTSHTATFTTDTKEVAVKPPASEAKSSASLYKGKRVTGLKVQLKCEGLSVYAETETGLEDILAKWKVGESVECAAIAREHDEKPYVSGKFIISSLEVSAPAGEDVTYSVTLDNDGPVTVDETNIEPAA